LPFAEVTFGERQIGKSNSPAQRSEAGVVTIFSKRTHLGKSNYPRSVA